MRQGKFYWKSPPKRSHHLFFGQPTTAKMTVILSAAKNPRICICRGCCTCRYCFSGSNPSSTGPIPKPRAPRFFRTGYGAAAATAGASTARTLSSIPLQYFKSAGRAEGTVCRIRQYHRAHSSSFALLFLIAFSTRVTSEKGGILFRLHTASPLPHGKSTGLV